MRCLNGKSHAVSDCSFLSVVSSWGQLLNQRIVNVILFACVLVVAYIAGKALVAGKVRTLQGIIGLALLGPLLWVAQTYGIKALLYFATLMYCIPLAMPPNRSILKELHVFEFAVWAFCAYLFVSGAARKQSPFSKKELHGIVPLLIFAIGGILAVLVNDISTINIIKLRILVFLPVGIYIVYNAIIDDVREAELTLRIAFISTLLLVLFFLVVWYETQRSGGVFHLGFIDASWVYSEPGGPFMYSGRMSLRIIMPQMGALVVEPAGMSVFASTIFAIGLTYWLGGTSLSGRLVGALGCAVMLLVMFLTQGLSGWVAALSSSMVVLLLVIKFRVSSFRTNIPKITILALLPAAIFAFMLSNVIASRALVLLDPLQAKTITSRFVRWEIALQTILNNPLGVGYSGGYYHGVFASHNRMLLWSLLVGIPGFLGIAWFFLLYFKRMLDTLQSADQNTAFLCVAGLGAVTAFLVGTIAEPGPGFPWQIALIWIPISVTMAGATVFNKEIE